MRPKAVCQLLAAITLHLLTVSLLFVRAAFAGDTATLNVLGFSADGSVFAFEEYGVQDGSGFLYANRFYINTGNDSFVPGSPIRVRLEDENASIATVRETARQQAQPIIADTDLLANPGLVAGQNAVTELNADPFRMVVNPRAVVPPIDEALEIRLIEQPFPATGTCDGIVDSVAGMRLLSIPDEPGQQVRVLADDQSVPRSRGCPLGYQIAEIRTFYPQAGEPVFAVMIAIRTFGFEGPDFRWMAVTAPLEPN
jgi:predicted secreted protein